MKVALTHNLRRSDSEDDAEFDSEDTVRAIAEALASGGHEVEPIEVSGSPIQLAARLADCSPDLLFNTAEGRRGRWREAFYPALFEELGYAYTGPDAYVLTVTLDKWLTKLIVSQEGVLTPRAHLVTDRERGAGSAATPLVRLPAIVKPNYEGSSKGIGDDVVARDQASLQALIEQQLRRYPAGVLVEEFIAGHDLSVPVVEGLGEDGVLTPVEYVVEPGARSRDNIYDYRLKNRDSASVSVRCPPRLMQGVVESVRESAKRVVRRLGLRDAGRLDFRLGADGRAYFLEANALPSFEAGASLFAATEREGLDYRNTLLHIVAKAAERWGLSLYARPPVYAPT